MKEMIKKMREEKGGFTIAELLIVVAIVGVLVAIAIPVFTGSLESANASTDEANIRSGWAQSQVYSMTGKDDAGNDVQNDAVYYLTKNAGLESANTNAYETKGSAANVSEAPTYMPNWSAGQVITYTFAKQADGSFIVTVGAAAKSGA